MHAREVDSGPYIHGHRQPPQNTSESGNAVAMSASHSEISRKGRAHAAQIDAWMAFVQDSGNTTRTLG